ncbi:MAG: nucleoside hydrolase [Actinobacteria bacterium]|nr:nucleoside hydrolase [Actinomycetota bacterium]NDC90830.1 nucleoside hydrolase [Acidimicrobiia bacterium]NBQ45075.1 nucleoside hydrolase [Actinomycetota bacterium]NBY62107.1 nucleoside hydrolase [Actinomycetota bacterium]NDB42031.1 nucleoside hydrolase [Actinomycetota bacterium]
MTQKMWIDTDTASDDAVALILALKSKSTEVLGISIVAGNVPIDLGVQAALYTLEMCGAKTPVHVGAHKPLVRNFSSAQNVHGSDGMGDIGLKLSGRKPTSTHAISEMIATFRARPNEIDLVTLGPLTNIALVLSIEPQFAKWVRRCVIMGGTGALPGNVTVASEFNVWADPEAARIVFDSGLPLEMVGWDVSVADAVISDELAVELSNLGKLGNFAMTIQRQVREFCRTETKLDGFDLPDPIAMAVALDSSIVESEIKKHVRVNLGFGDTRGQTMVDHLNTVNKIDNCRVVLRVNRQKFIAMLRTALEEK